MALAPAGATVHKDASNAPENISFFDSLEFTEEEFSLPLCVEVRLCCLKALSPEAGGLL